MRFSQIIKETSSGSTGSGSVATISSPLGSTQSRNASIYGDTKVGNLLKGKKTNKPFVNSLSEGKVKQLAIDLKNGVDGLTDDEFKKKYGKTKAEVRKEMRNKPQTQEKPVQEARLEEEDKIIPVGKGKKLKTGLHGKTEEPKFKGYRAPFKSQGIFVADKRGNKVCDCENETVAHQVAKALTAYAIANEVNLQGAGTIAGGLQYESIADKEDLKAKRQQLQKLQMDPSTSKDPKLKAELARRKAELEKQAKEKGLQFESMDSNEYDMEGDFAKNQLHTIKRMAEILVDKISDDENLPEWVQMKISNAEGMLVRVTDYLISEKEQGDTEPEDNLISEKAVSKAQQRFMGMAHAIQKGKKIPGASKELKAVAKGMTKKAGHDFAATKHKGLPEKVKKD